MKRKIALDSMIFIYHFEQAETYIRRVREILLSAQKGENELVTSVMSVVQALSAPKHLHLLEVVNEISYFFKEAEFLRVVELDWEIALETARLRRENGSLRTPDAVQLATAIVSGAEVFVTNDLKLRNMKSLSVKIKVVGLEESELNIASP